MDRQVKGHITYKMNAFIYAFSEGTLESFSTKSIVKLLLNILFKSSNQLKCGRIKECIFIL